MYATSKNQQITISAKMPLIIQETICARYGTTETCLLLLSCLYNKRSNIVTCLLIELIVCAITERELKQKISLVTFTPQFGFFTVKQTASVSN